MGRMEMQVQWTRIQGPIILFIHPILLILSKNLQGNLVRGTGFV